MSDIPRNGVDRSAVSRNHHHPHHQSAIPSPKRDTIVLEWKTARGRTLYLRDGRPGRVQSEDYRVAGTGGVHESILAHTLLGRGGRGYWMDGWDGEVWFSTPYSHYGRVLHGERVVGAPMALSSTTRSRKECSLSPPPSPTTQTPSTPLKPHGAIHAPSPPPITPVSPPPGPSPRRPRSTVTSPRHETRPRRHLPIRIGWQRLGQAKSARRMHGVRVRGKGVMLSSGIYM